MRSTSYMYIRNHIYSMSLPDHIHEQVLSSIEKPCVDDLEVVYPQCKPWPQPSCVVPEIVLLFMTYV